MKEEGKEQTIELMVRETHTMARTNDGLDGHTVSH